MLASPELARTKHDYGKGRPIRDKEGRNILYWVNPDLIKADRFANYKARLARPKKAENDKVVETKFTSFSEMSQEEMDHFNRQRNSSLQTTLFRVTKIKHGGSRC